MIFYFSATGNSLYVAKRISASLHEPLISIAKAMNDPESSFEYTLDDGESIGFVFPLFAWSAPKMVFDFIRKLKFINYNDNYLFAVTTYGQNIGRFDKFFNKELESKNMTLDSGFSVNMPNNYIYIWDKAKQDDCLKKAEKTIDRIIDVVSKRESVFEIETVPNSEITGPKMNPWFNSTLTDVSEFYVNDDCIGCGLCTRVCNGQTLSLVNGKPHWGNQCTKCFACLHLCPKHAIQFGKITETNGRYKNPNIKLNELVLFPERNE